MESLPEIDVVNSNPSELLATPLNITIQQNVNEDNNFLQLSRSYRKYPY